MGNQLPWSASKIIANIRHAIAGSWERKRKYTTPLKIGAYNSLEDSSSWVKKVESILAVEGSAASAAAVTVLSTLLDIEKKDKGLLKKENIDQPLSSHLKQSTIIMTESQLRDGNLFALQSHGFGGAVLVLSDNSLESLRKKHPTLDVEGSHDVCGYSCTLPNLLTKVAKELEPLSEGNLEQLQQRISEYMAARHNGSFEKAFSLLEQLKQKDSSFLDKLDDFKNAVDDLLEEYPEARHDVRFEGKRICIYFKKSIERIRTSPQECDHKQIERFQEALEQLQKRVLEIGEGFEKFS